MSLTSSIADTAELEALRPAGDDLLTRSVADVSMLSTYSSHRALSSVVGAIRPGGRTAVVLGAGPGGLMAALTLRDEGFEHVVVLEKRCSFSRFNIVNLHPESLHILHRLGLIDRFLHRASRIIEHRGFVFAAGMASYEFQDVGFEVELDPEQAFDVHDVKDGFKNETLYSISVADLQSLLAEIALERGIQIVAEADVELVAGVDGTYSVRAMAGARRADIAIDAPTLIVLAEGARGERYQALGGRYVKQESLWPQETWVFGNFKCSPPHGCSYLMFEFYNDCDDLTISNCILLPRIGEVNISVTVTDPEISAARIEELIATQAAKVLRVAGIPSPDPRVVWTSAQPVRIAPKSAVRNHFGKNVILAGDVSGANSPTAALGATLCTSAYPYAIGQLVRDLASEGPDAALARYGDRCQSYVRLWHSKVIELRKMVNLDMRHKTMQRMVS